MTTVTLSKETAPEQTIIPEALNKLRTIETELRSLVH
jgi:hypothetical protein